MREEWEKNRAAASQSHFEKIYMHAGLRSMPEVSEWWTKLGSITNISRDGMLEIFEFIYANICTWKKNLQNNSPSEFSYIIEHSLRR